MTLPLSVLIALTGVTFVARDALLAQRSQTHGSSLSAFGLAVLSAASLAFVGFLFANHIDFPLNLDLMEGTILQHVQRAAALEPVYPAPTPEFVPLAYTVLNYYLSVPFTWLFGANLFTLRLVAILGTVGSGAVLFLVVLRLTGSRWWAFIAIGLFASAYQAMDVYLDTAHSDSWMLFSALLGGYLIGLEKGRTLNLSGVLLLVASFWFKQHGALFAIAGVLYLSMSEGLRASLIYWATALLLGPVLYIIAGPWLFGSHFHYFTWVVPSAWSTLDTSDFIRYFRFILRNYAVLSLAASIFVLHALITHRREFGVWSFLFVAALLSGFMGTLDQGSSSNVFIPMGFWFILAGVPGLRALAVHSGLRWRQELCMLALFASFAAFVRDPAKLIIKPDAALAYADLVGMLQSLDGHVYAPSLGQLQTGYTLYPAAHWVALDDMVRGPGRDERNQPSVRHLIEPDQKPGVPDFILTNGPIEKLTPALSFLLEDFALTADFGTRYEPLKCLEKPINHGYPRYLYRRRSAIQESSFIGPNA